MHGIKFNIQICPLLTYIYIHVIYMAAVLLAYIYDVAVNVWNFYMIISYPHCIYLHTYIYHTLCIYTHSILWSDFPTSQEVVGLRNSVQPGEKWWGFNQQSDGFIWWGYVEIQWLWNMIYENLNSIVIWWNSIVIGFP